MSFAKVMFICILVYTGFCSAEQQSPFKKYYDQFLKVRKDTNASIELLEETVNQLEEFINEHTHNFVDPNYLECMRILQEVREILPYLEEDTPYQIPWHFFIASVCPHCDPIEIKREADQHLENAVESLLMSATNIGAATGFFCLGDVKEALGFGAAGICTLKYSILEFWEAKRYHDMLNDNSSSSCTSDRNNEGYDHSEFCDKRGEEEGED